MFQRSKCEAGEKQSSTYEKSMEAKIRSPVLVEESEFLFQRAA